MKKFSKGLAAGVFLLLAGSAQAQNAVVQYKTTQTAPGSVTVTPTTPLPIAQGGTPFHVANAGGNSPCALTINAGAAGKYIYITDFWVTGAGATAASNIIITYTGLAGGTSYDSVSVPAGATTSIPLLEHHLTYPWQAAAAAAQVQISVAAFGSGNTSVACHVNGFYL